VIPYEYVEYEDRDGRRVIIERVISDWTREDRQRRALKTRLVMLLQADRNQAVGSLMFKTKEEGIYYAKIRGNVALRPRLCLGPKDTDNEVTFLHRATEKDMIVTPRDADKRAAARMKEVLQDDSRRLKIRVKNLGKGKRHG
jgi:hypothetical protein